MDQTTWAPHRDRGARHPTPLEPPRPDLGGFVARVLLVALIVAIALLAWSWRHVLLLALASILVAAGLRGIAKPIVDRTNAPQGLALLIAGLIIIGALAAIGFIFGAQIAAQVDTLTETLPGAFQNFRARLQESEPGRVALGQIDALTGPGGALQGAVQRAGRLGATFANAALEALLVVVAGIFFALSPVSYRDGVALFFPRSVRPRIVEAMDLAGAALRGWLGGTLLSMLAITVMIGVGLWLLGVPAPLGLALLAGLSQFVPLIGPTLSAAPAMLLALTISPLTSLWVALLYFGATTLEANVLTPVIQKRASSQPPVLTVYSVVAFGLIFGPLGVLLAVPTMVVLTVFVVKFYLNGALGESVRAPGEKVENGRQEARGRLPKGSKTR